MPNRLFIVSNRLLITVDDNKVIKQASGGLITAMNGFIGNIKKESFTEMFWAGIPGCSSGTWDATRKSIGDSSTIIISFILITGSSK